MFLSYEADSSKSGILPAISLSFDGFQKFLFCVLDLLFGESSALKLLKYLNPFGHNSIFTKPCFCYPYEPPSQPHKSEKTL